MKRETKWIIRFWCAWMLLGLLFLFPQYAYQKLLVYLDAARTRMTLPVLAAGGACPVGAGYINPSNPTGSLVTLSSLGISSCYYVSAAGLDTNSGTTEGAAFLHAPGMPNFTGSATASTSTGVIVRGGDTWHRSSGSPLMGGVWTVGAWGYVGVDPTWFSGGSFARPIISMDNSLSTNTVATCNVADDGAATPIIGVSLSGRSNLTFDDFEFTGACSSGTGNGEYLNSGSAVIVERLYIHGWTLTTTANDDTYEGVRGGGGTGNRYLYLVIDGGDSTYGTTCNAPSCVASTATNGATGWAMGDCFDVEYSVIRHVSNALQCNNIGIVHDNFFEYVFEPSFGGRHGNISEAIGGTATSTCNFYNNLTRNTFSGVGWWLQCTTAYVFDNVWENEANGGNCLIVSPPGFSNTAVLVTAFLANNTADGTCSSYSHVGNASTPHPAVGSAITAQNMHVLDRTAIFGGGSHFFTPAGTCVGGSNAGAGCTSSGACAGGSCSLMTQTDSGGEKFQTTAAANTNGYCQLIGGSCTVPDFQPSNALGITIGAGNTLTSSCSTYSADSALCSGTSRGVSEQSGSGGLVAVYPGVSLVNRLSSWDTGAYQFFAIAPSLDTLLEGTTGHQGAIVIK